MSSHVIHERVDDYIDIPFKNQEASMLQKEEELLQYLREQTDGSGPTISKK